MKYSDKEIDLIKHFGFEEIADRVDPITLYRIMVERAFLENSQGDGADSLRRCFNALRNGNPLRKTKEWDDMISLEAEGLIDLAMPIAVPLIAEFEGFRSTAYQDPAGIWTIGYGHIQSVKKGDKTTKEEATQWLEEETKHFMTGVLEMVNVPLNKNQVAALTSFTYNLGLSALSNSTLLKKLNARDYAAASDEFYRWVHVKGKVLNGLVQRRSREAELFISDVGDF